MHAHDAIMSRHSCRRFLDTPVPEDALARILEGAGMAPSGHNIQPWRVYVVTGEAQKRVSDAVLKTAMTGGKEAQEEEYDYYPVEWFEPYKSRRRQIGYDLYASLGIERDDYDARTRQMLRNFLFFDAPLGLFITVSRRLSTGTFIDMGMFIENILIGARGEGLHTCGQVAWCPYHKVVREVVGFPDDELLVCGVAIGYADADAPENKLRAQKADWREWTTFVE